MNRVFKAGWFIIATGAALALWGSGVIPPIIPAAVPAASKQGNGAMFQLSTGTTTAGNCAEYDGNGNTVDSGIVCNGGAGSGTVSAGTQYQIAQYTGAGTTTTVAGVSIPNCIDTAGQHVNFTLATGAFSCGTSGGSSGAALPNVRFTAAALSVQALATPRNAVAGDYIFVIAGNGGAITGVSDTQGNTYTQIDTGTNAGNVAKMWFAAVGSSAALTVTWTGTPNFPVTALLEIVPPAGFAGTLDSHAAMLGAGASMTTTQANQIVIVGCTMQHSADVAQFLSPLFLSEQLNQNDAVGIGYGLLQTASQPYWIQTKVMASGTEHTDYTSIAGILK